MGSSGLQQVFKRMAPGHAFKMITLLSMLLVVYGVLNVVFLAMDVSKPVADACRGAAFKTDSTGTKLCVDASAALELKGNQGWTRDNTHFKQFHREKLSSPTLAASCQEDLPAGYALDSIELGYHLTNATTLGQIRCPDGMVCIIEAVLEINKPPKIRVHPFAVGGYPQLLQRVSQLAGREVYHMVVKGPATGPLRFTTILVERKSSFVKRIASWRLHAKKWRSAVKYCGILLKDAVPDGFISFGRE